MAKVESLSRIRGDRLSQFVPGASHAFRAPPSPSADSERAPSHWRARAASWPALHARRRRWAELLRLVFKVDVEVCARCGGAARIIGFVTEPAAITRILAHPRASRAARGGRPGRTVGGRGGGSGLTGGRRASLRA